MTSTSNVMLERRGLIRTFNRLKDNRIIYVCAPAGYGKTVAVTQWMEKDIRAKAIFAMDEYDNNLAGFCERFCIALRACQPQNQTLRDIISHPSFQSAPEEFTLRAVSALTAGKRAVLAIDDLHVIYNDEVLKLLLILIKRLPKNFYIILISRHDLPVGFSDLWLKGHVASVNTEQFLFTNAEIMALCDKCGNQITQKSAEDIGKKTHGWAIAINAFLLFGNESFDKVYDYLDTFVRENIWEKWDDTTRGFMLSTAGLRELTPAVCEAMTGVIPANKFLKELVKKGAFIAQAQDKTFHYHHLFRQFLQRKMNEEGEDFVNSLLEREGNWHLSQKDFYNAIDCFIRCKNHEGIDKCYDLLESDSHHDSYEIEKILPVFKNPEIKNASEKYPRLLFLMLWCACVEGRAEDAVSFMDEFYIKYPGSVNDILYLKTPVKLSVSMHMPQLYRGIIDFSELAVGDVVENFMTLLPKEGWLYGEGSPMLGEIVISGLLYEQGHLDSAYQHALSALAEMKSYYTPESKFCAFSALILVSDAVDESDSNEHSKALEALSIMIEQNNAYYLTNNFNALSMRRKFVSGNVKAAKEWIKCQTFDDATLWGLYAAFTTCRAYIVLSEYDSAIILLKKILKPAIAFNRPLDIIEAQILLAIAFWKKKRAYQKDALEHLEAAICVAYPYGYVQMFVSDGAVLAGMLWKLKKQLEYRKIGDEKIISFIKMIHLKVRPLANSLNITDESHEKPIVLTDKQRDVMVLLCQGKRYKEAAEILGVKQSTIVSHIELIYNKLDVTNLSDCVAKVNAMGLLAQ